MRCQKSWFWWEYDQWPCLQHRLHRTFVNIYEYDTFLILLSDLKLSEPKNLWLLGQIIWVLATFWQICVLCKGFQYLGLPIANLSKGCQYPLALWNKFSKDCHKPLWKFQDDCPSFIQNGDLPAIPLKKINFKFKRWEATSIFNFYLNSIS